MPYPEMMVAPMREDLTRIGVQELKTADQVDQFIADKTGSALLVINSVCGCAAGQARPAVAVAMQHENRPDRVATVFAGVDTEATQCARGHFPDLPPSSPSMILLNEGELIEYIPRHRIENRDANAIAGDIIGVVEKITP